jgi:hypothetical protein
MARHSCSAGNVLLFARSLKKFSTAACSGLPIVAPMLAKPTKDVKGNIKRADGDHRSTPTSGAPVTRRTLKDVLLGSWIFSEIS